jgi:hypothetical protein
VQGNCNLSSARSREKKLQNSKLLSSVINNLAAFPSIFPKQMACPCCQVPKGLLSGYQIHINFFCGSGSRIFLTADPDLYQFRIQKKIYS